LRRPVSALPTVGKQFMRARVTVVSTDQPIAQHHDQLPADLDAHGYVGPYLFPDNSRRRYLAGALAVVGGLLVLWWSLARDTSAIVNDGTLAVGVGLLIVALYITVTSASMKVREIDALKIALRQLDFGAGPASAQMGWRGFLSRPTWRILVFSPETPPLQQGFVLVDALDGSVVSVIKQELDGVTTPDTV